MTQNKAFFRKILVMGLVLLMLLTGCSDGQSADIKSEYMDPGQIAANEYRTTTVKVGDFEINYSVDSRMTYRRARFMYWLHGEDHYQDLLVENEQVVEKGQVLATFEVDVSPADILERELAVTEAQGSLSSLATSYESRIAAKQTADQSSDQAHCDHGKEHPCRCISHHLIHIFLTIAVNQRCKIRFAESEEECDHHTEQPQTEC